VPGRTEENPSTFSKGRKFSGLNFNPPYQ